MLVAFALYPIGEYVLAAGYLLWREGYYVAAGRFVVLNYGVFEYVNVGVRAEYAHIVVVCARGYCVVAIDKGYILALCSCKAGVAGRGEAAILLVYYAHFVALLGVTVADCSAVVGRAVIDEDKLVVGVCLLQNALYAVLQVSSDFIYRDYDA